ncbi:hypothetical protein ACKGJO_09295 [Gracilimonas sp. Q87]|uniref:hypothetical protein n=1 Tax=Gracilimonas sp. Q87 TaxID=3384766 RepID=UPI00398414E2
MNELITNILFIAFGILYGGILILALWWKVYLPLEGWVSHKMEERRKQGSDY